jgi:hypothetical protein
LVVVVVEAQPLGLAVMGEQETLEQIALRLVIHLLVEVELVVVVQAQVLQAAQVVVEALLTQGQEALVILLLQVHLKVTLVALVLMAAVQHVCLVAVAVQLMLEPLVNYLLQGQEVLAVTDQLGQMG